MTPDLVLLGRMLWGSQETALALADLADPAHFVTKATRRLFLLMAREAAKGYSPVTISALVRTEAPDCVALLTSLQGEMGSAAIDDDASHEALVAALSAWSQRTKFDRALDYATQSLDKGATYEEARNTLDRHLTAIDLAALGTQSYDDRHAMAARVQAYLASDTTSALRYGFVNLDRKVVPLREGNFVLVGGTSGSGKSTLLRNLVRNFVRAEVPTALLSFEMTGEEQLPNFACMDARVDVRAFIEKAMTWEEGGRFGEALQWWVETPHFRLNERASVTPEWILRTLRRYRAEGFRVLVVDHLHRVQYTRDGKGEIRLAISEFARALKSFAVDASCILIAGVQYTKLSKHQEPDDQNIRESNTILEEADAVLHTWRPLVAGHKTHDGQFVPTVRENGARILERDAAPGDDLGMDDGRVYVKIGKQRVRPSGGFVALPFNPASGLIADLDAAQAARWAA